MDCVYCRHVVGTRRAVASTLIALLIGLAAAPRPGVAESGARETDASLQRSLGGFSNSLSCPFIRLRTTAGKQERDFRRQGRQSLIRAQTHHHQRLTPADVQRRLFPGAVPSRKNAPHVRERPLDFGIGLSAELSCGRVIDMNISRRVRLGRHLTGENTVTR